MRCNPPLCAFFAVALGATTLPAQREHPISAVIRAPARGIVAKPGEAFSVVLAVDIPNAAKHWHLYSITQPAGGPIRTEITVRGPAELHLAGTIMGPAPEFADDPNFGIMTETYSDSAIFSVPVASDPAARGKKRLVLGIYYQTCNDRYCLPPATDTIGVDITFAGMPVVAAVNNARSATSVDSAALLQPSRGVPVRTAPPVPAVRVEHRAPPALPGQGSLALFLWIAATMGALSLLTPCVFPMVPITVSYFSRGEARSRAQAFRDASVYAVGIVAAFTSLGLGLTFLLGATGLNRFAANPWLNLGVAALFAAFALSLFGVFNLVVSGRVLTRIDAVTRGNRFGRDVTTLLMGATFALTSFTCTAPFVGTLLVSAAQGSWTWPALGLLTFSFVFALPFIVLALVPELLNALPRSGEWMVTLKVTLGFVEMAAALKFVSNADLVLGWGVFTRDFVLGAWLVLGIALVAYLAGLRVTLRGISRSRAYVIPAALVLVLLTWLATGLRGRRLGELEAFLPPAGSSANSAELPWILNNYDQALALARRENKYVLIDFTGYTCTNCRWMEANMFPKPEVRNKLQNFVRVRLFTDGRDASNVQQQTLEERMYGTVALPLYGIVDASGVSHGEFLGMTRNTDEFVSFLSGKSSRAR